MRLAAIGTQRPRKKNVGIPFLGNRYHMKSNENETLIDHITKWYVKEFFWAALPSTEAPKVRVMASQRYASVPFLGTT